LSGNATRGGRGENWQGKNAHAEFLMMECCYAFAVRISTKIFRPANIVIISSHKETGDKFQIAENYITR
jgi:hypothetical protein